MGKFNFPKHNVIGKIQDLTEGYGFYEKNDFIAREKPLSIKSIGLVLPLLFALIIISRLFLLQIQEGFINYKLAEGNRIRNFPIAAPRGNILDRNGEVLVSNELAYDLIVQANSKRDLDLIDESSFEIVGVSKDEVEKIVIENSNKTGFVTVRERVDRDQAMLLKSRLPAYGRFEIVPVFVRKYTDPSLSHVLGYIGKFNQTEEEIFPQYLINRYIGKVGIEKTYDQYLQGTPGTRRVEVDASGNVIRVLSTIDPEPGQTLHTTIDLNLQKALADSLTETIDKNGDGGVAVAMDPRNGSIRALVSYPSYDSQTMSRGVSEDEYQNLISDSGKLLLNRASSGVYPSGSSIKPFIASSALEYGVIDRNTAFETPPFIEIDEWRFPDWKDHGYTDVKLAIAESNNIFFYAIGGGWGPVKTGLGPEGIKRGLEAFGFGKKTEFDLGSEEVGLIPTPEWKEKRTGEPWYIGNTYHMAIGQGDLLVTPLQLINATCSIANGGTLYRPRTVEYSSYSEQKKKDFSLENNVLTDSVMNGDNLSLVRDGMRMTVTHGSARSIFPEDFVTDVSAKTGTAQYGNKSKTHAWFTSYAPNKDPELSITVLVEGGGEGYETAAPVAKDGFNAYFN